MPINKYSWGIAVMRLPGRLAGESSNSLMTFWSRLFLDYNVISDACKDRRPYALNVFYIFDALKRPSCLSKFIYFHCRHRTDVRQADQFFEAGLVDIDRAGHLLFALLELKTIVVLLKMPSCDLLVLRLRPSLIAKSTKAIDQLVNINAAIFVTIWKVSHFLSVLVNFHKCEGRIRQKPDRKI